MSTLMVSIVTVLYLFTAVDRLMEKDSAMAIVFFGYALANLGLIQGFKQ